MENFASKQMNLVCVGNIIDMFVTWIKGNDSIYYRDTVKEKVLVAGVEGTWILWKRFRQFPELHLIPQYAKNQEFGS